MPFQPGESGNPNGRPKRGQSMSDELRKVLSEKADSGKPNRREIAKKLVDIALKGNVLAIKEIFDRLDGKPTQPISGADGDALKVEVDVKDALIARIAAIAARTAEDSDPQ